MKLNLEFLSIVVQCHFQNVGVTKYSKKKAEEPLEAPAKTSFPAANDEFWNYFTEQLTNMTAQQKVAFMDV